MAVPELARNSQSADGVRPRSSPTALRPRRRTSTPTGLARSFLRAICAVSEVAGGACAELAFRRPPRFGSTRRERELLDRAARSFVPGPLGEIAVWHWGQGPRVLLAHGWGSHAGRLTPFIAGLTAAGFGVSAFDAPGHGESRGRFASLPEFVDALMLVARSVTPVAFIGHSLGAAACALALRSGVGGRAAVLLSPPADPSAFTRRYARWLRLPAAAAEVMCRRLESRYGAPLETYRLLDEGPGVPTMIIHDRGDFRIPITDGRALARSWPDTELVETRGLGHHRILKDPSVLRRAARFLAARILGAALVRRASLRMRHAS
jgi:pimeloyl-ACP methyl ester carboxylesterase